MSNPSKEFWQIPAGSPYYFAAVKMMKGLVNLSFLKTWVAQLYHDVMTTEFAFCSWKQCSTLANGTPQPNAREPQVETTAGSMGMPTAYPGCTRAGKVVDGWVMGREGKPGACLRQWRGGVDFGGKKTRIGYSPGFPTCPIPSLP